MCTRVCKSGDIANDSQHSMYKVFDDDDEIPRRPSLSGVPAQNNLSATTMPRSKSSGGGTSGNMPTRKSGGTNNPLHENLFTDL